MREFLKSVMNTGQPYVEKNRYFVAERPNKTYKNSRKNGTETAPTNNRNKSIKNSILQSQNSQESAMD